MKTVRRYLLGMSIGLVAVAGITACRKGVSAAQQQQDPPQGADPSDQNMVLVDSSGHPIQAANESQQQAAQYAAGGAPIERRAPESGQPDQSQQAPAPGQPNYAQDELYGDQDTSGEPPVYADQAPPELPVYDQPEAPAPNYLWTPGYWDYATAGYYWVPGVWVAAPYPGALWTPCYWGFYGGRYRFYPGYWGTHIGFYGGINYGFGYYGEGYRGGYWNGNNFYYNRMINRVSPRITNVYMHNVTIANVGSRVSYNGGRGGLQVQPRPAEVAAMRGPRIPPMSTQRSFQRQASENRQQFYNQNLGRPAMPATILPVTADKGIQRPNAVQPSNGFRPGQPGRQEVPPVNRPQTQPARPVSQQPYRPYAQPGVRPTPESRPTPQPEVRPNQQYRPEAQQPRPNVEQPRPSQPRPAPEYRTPPAASRPVAPASPQIRTAPPPQQPRPAPSHTEPEHPH